MTALRDIPLYDWVKTHFTVTSQSIPDPQPQPGLPTDQQVTGDTEDNALVSEWISELYYDEPATPVSKPVYATTDPVDELFDDWVEVSTPAGSPVVAGTAQESVAYSSTAGNPAMIPVVSAPAASDEPDLSRATSRSLSKDLLDED